MAKRKSKAQKEAEKFIRKNKKAVVTALTVLVIILLVVALVIYVVNPDFYKNLFNKNDGPNVNIPAGTYEDVESADLSIHFLELGNKYTGDCTLIKVGNTEVLIDAGSRKGSAPHLKNYIDQFCTDGVLEYVIATHAHQDHIAAFVGNKNNGNYNGLLYTYEIGTLIKFSNTRSTSGIYGEFCEAVDYIEDKGTTVYNALQCYNNQDGAQRTYYLNAEQTVSMNILYNYYYDHPAPDQKDENDYSVCMLLSQELGENDNHYLFTGDLEEHGEEKLVEYNTLPKVKLFKGAHHGSYTANTDKLLDVIQPEHVAICCCCGTEEFGAKEENRFPAQDAVERISKHTDSIYCTTLITDWAKGQYTSMNGNIIFYYLEDDEPDDLENPDQEKSDPFKLWCSNNTTKLKDSDWYKQNRK